MAGVKKSSKSLRKKQRDRRRTWDLKEMTWWWEHDCPAKNDIMSFQKGDPCDWCGATEGK